MERLSLRGKPFFCFKVFVEGDGIRLKRYFVWWLVRRNREKEKKKERLDDCIDWIADITGLIFSGFL